MAKSIERYFRLLPAQRRQRPSDRLWSPAADVYETADGWIVKVDLAGVRLEEIEIEIKDQDLRIAGIRRDTMCSETIAYHQLEITYSRFEKTLHFPCAIEGTSIERDYHDGLLILRLRSSGECE